MPDSYLLLFASGNSIIHRRFKSNSWGSPRGVFVLRSTFDPAVEIISVCRSSFADAMHWTANPNPVELAMGHHNLHGALRPHRMSKGSSGLKQPAKVPQSIQKPWHNRSCLQLESIRIGSPANEGISEAGAWQWLGLEVVVHGGLVDMRSCLKMPKLAAQGRPKWL